LLKKNSKNRGKKERRLCQIAFKGTVAKMSIGIKCENPEKDWKSGMFEK
jgi:hypothetical protein